MRSHLDSLPYWKTLGSNRGGVGSNNWDLAILVFGFE